MQLYIIRHAQSYNNALPDQRERHKDPALTDLGLQQAQIVAKHLAEGINLEQKIGVSEEDTALRKRQGYKIDRLYCSAMYRALQTTQPISQALGLEPEVWLDIHEHGGIYLDNPNGGVTGYPGLTRSEILAEFPDYRLPEALTADGWWHNGFEDWPSCHMRAIRTARTLRRWAEQEDRIALVTHGGFIDSLLKALTNQLPSTDIFYYHYNTAISRLDFNGNGQLDIRYINRVDHLPPELVS